MGQQTIDDAVTEIFERRLQASDIDPSRLLTEYGLDSVRSIELIVELEKAFGVSISDDVAAEMNTLSDVMDAVRELGGHNGQVG